MKLSLYLSVEGVQARQASTSLLGNGEQRNSRMRDQDSALYSHTENLPVVRFNRHSCAGTTLEHSFVWPCRLSKPLPLVLAHKAYGLYTSAELLGWDPQCYQSNKAKRLPQPNRHRLLSQQYAQAILVRFRTKILGDLFVIPNLNSTLRTYNDAHQNRLAGSIHAYSLRWPGAYSHGSRLYSLC